MARAREAGSALGLMDWLAALMTWMAVSFQSLITSAPLRGATVRTASARPAAMRVLIFMVCFSFVLLWSWIRSLVWSGRGSDELLPPCYRRKLDLTIQAIGERIGVPMCRQVSLLPPSLASWSADSEGRLRF